jgi:hypothetical protein
MSAALAETGFTHVKATVLGQDWHVRSADQILQAVLKGAVRSRALLGAQSDAETKAIRGFFEKTLSELPRAGSDYCVPLPAILGSGTKP